MHAIDYLLDIHNDGMSPFTLWNSGNVFIWFSLSTRPRGLFTDIPWTTQIVKLKYFSVASYAIKLHGSATQLMGRSYMNACRLRHYGRIAMFSICMNGGAVAGKNNLYSIANLKIHTNSELNSRGPRTKIKKNVDIFSNYSHLKIFIIRMCTLYSPIRFDCW